MAAVLCGLVAGACGGPSPTTATSEAKNTSTTTTTVPLTPEQLQAALLTPQDMPGYAQYPTESVTEGDSGGEGGCPGKAPATETQKAKAGFYTDGSVLQVVELISLYPQGTAAAMLDWVDKSARCPPHDETVAGVTYTVTPKGQVPAPEAGDSTFAQSIDYSGGFVGNRIEYDVLCGDMRVSVQATQKDGPVNVPGAAATLRTALERVNSALGRQACTLPPA